MPAILKNQPELIKEVGKAAFGHLWMAITARELGKDQKWLHRAVEEPPMAIVSIEQGRALRRILAKRQAEVTKALAKLDKALEGATDA